MKTKEQEFAAVESRAGRLSAVLFGDPRVALLETRIFNATMLLVFCAGVVAALANAVYGSSGAVRIVTAAATVVAISAYAISRRYGVWKPLVVPVFVGFLCFLSYGWIVQGGLDGGFVYFFFLLSCAAVIAFRGAGKISALALTCLAVLSLILVEATLPDVIRPYASRLQRYMDVSLCLVLCLLINGIMTYAVFGEYQRERHAKNLLLRSVVREKEKAEKAVTGKQRLLSMVCHDIANSLTLILGNAALLGRSEAGAQHGVKERLDGIELGSVNIKEIIESVRMVQAVEEGITTIKLERVRLEDMFAHARQILVDRLMQKSLKLEVSLADDGGSWLLVEPRIFCNHILSNLLSNAIKFSYPGSGIVVRGEKRNGMAMVSVIDQGMGIPVDLLEQLFLTGAKTSRQGTNSEPGTGLGLFVVKSFVELFGGRIEVASRAEEEYPQDHGTTVTMHLQSG